jgi:hypothetical protein
MIIVYSDDYFLRLERGATEGSAARVSGCRGAKKGAKRPTEAVRSA